MESARNLEKDVLFQKVGNTWFIFTEINDDVVYSTLPAGMDPKTTKLEFYHIIEKHLEKVSRNSPKKDIGTAI